MSGDRFHDGEDVEPAPDQEPRPDPGLERAAHPRDHGELSEENADLGRAVGELASENADLHKRVDYLERQVATEKDRFAAWAREMAWREEVLKSRLERLERSAVEKAGPGIPDRRLGERAAPEAEKQTAKEPRRRVAADQTISAGVAVGGVALTAVSEIIGTQAASDVTGMLGQVATSGAAVLAWLRWRREGGNADRT